MTDALAALGLLALLTSGELNRWMTVAIVVGLVVALAIPERWQEKPILRRLGVIGPLVMFGVQAARLSMGEALLPVSIEFAAGLQVLRLLTRRGAAHDQQVVVLALLHLIAGTVLGAGLAYGLCFLGFMVVAPGALVLSHLRREVEGNYRQGARDRTGLPVDVPRILRSRRVIGKRFLLVTCLLSVPIFVFTAVLFILFPRVGLSLLLLNNPRERMTGFSERVDLGGVGKLRSDPTIVMRVEPGNVPATPPARLALYLKGTAFDAYDGRSWSRTPGPSKLLVEQSGRQVKLKRFPDPRRDSTMRVDLDAIDPPIVFLPGDAVALSLLTSQSALPSSRPQLYYGNEGTLYYRSHDERGLRYEVSLADQADRKPEELTTFERARYLALPNLPHRVAELAESWTADLSDPREMARRIEARLRSGYTYDLDSPSGGAKNPLEHFLFESKRGHCEFYSTAMAVMLRTRGVPTRNVTGFVGGTFNRFSQTYAVRQGDAHSWVEVYLSDTGWTRFDPTPPSGATPQSEINGALVVLRDLIEAMGQRWNRHVVGYDLKQQIWLFQGVRDTYRKLVPERDGSFTGRLVGSPRRTLLALLAAAGLVWAVRELWLRRRKAAPQEELSLAERRALQIVELYQALDRVMTQRGAARPSGTPPLAHARSLVALNHPIAQEVLELTEIYLKSRFGGELLSEGAVNDFAARVRTLKQPPRQEKAAA
ncbi:MAG TPA: DUF3488 and transglutaminase-like domain-containing protein [Polyangiaceae bacterium]|nr:DUF3488 and transglutaminase-like domain-containing protein [Polyangiaceae bacterium]